MIALLSATIDVKLIKVNSAFWLIWKADIKAGRLIIRKSNYLKSKYKNKDFEDRESSIQRDLNENLRFNYLS